MYSKGSISSLFNVTLFLLLSNHHSTPIRYYPIQKKLHTKSTTAAPNYLPNKFSRTPLPVSSS